MDKQYCFTYQRYDSTGDLSSEDRQLVSSAREACGTSYAPYSGFRVGAAARLRSGAVIVSSNQESGVLPAGICAERNLITTWQASHAGDPIDTLAIASDPGEHECYPCGICRQAIYDTQRRQGSPLRVIMSSQNSATVVPDAECLMPFTFKF